MKKKNSSTSNHKKINNSKKGISYDYSRAHEYRIYTLTIAGFAMFTPLGKLFLHLPDILTKKLWIVFYEITLAGICTYMGVYLILKSYGIAEHLCKPKEIHK